MLFTTYLQVGDTVPDLSSWKQEWTLFVHFDVCYSKLVELIFGHFGPPSWNSSQSPQHAKFKTGYAWNR